MGSAGIREFKDNVSRYVRRAEAGERITVTSHGRVVAELGPPSHAASHGPSRIDVLIAAGVVSPATKTGPLPAWPDIRLPKGTAAALIDEDRDDR